MVTTKLLLLFVVAIILVGLFVWHALYYRVLELPRTLLLPALIAFGLLSFLSSVLASPYPVENLLGLGGAYVGAALIAIVGGILLAPKTAKHFQLVLNASLIVLVVLSITQALGFGPSRFLNTLFPYLGLPNTGLLNVAGSPFLAAQLFVLGIAANGLSWLKTKKADALTIVALGASIVGLLLTVPLILPGKEASPALLPLGVSWTVGVDVLKAPRSALIGVGPENYSSAYAILKPAWINGQVWWNLPFGQGFDVPITLLVTGGLLTLIAWLFLAFRTVVESHRQLKMLPFIGGFLIGSIVLQLLFPVNIPILIVQAVAWAFLIANMEPRKVSVLHIFKISQHSHFFPFSLGDSKQPRSGLGKAIPLVIAVVIMGSSLYLVGRAYAASKAFFDASVAIQSNDAVRVYELQQQATILNPYVASYRSNYALTNLAIASALASKADITDQEREQVAALIQQSIREARAATVLRPDDSTTWLTLAQVYRNLIGSAEGAEDWTVSSYVEAINTNPTDPLTRIELGGVFFSQQQFDQAAALFQQAAELKPDLPNAYYNLANALKAAGRLQDARTVYQQLLTLLPADSEAYIQANGELEEVEEQIAAQPEGEGAEVTGPNLPSITEQNVLETSSQVLNQPSTESLGELNQTTLETDPEVSPSPTASPTP